ncbi:procollagen-lysine,2-oxoglutarate 5-dioxygenase [Diachasmimorpha longicaudata]|uniref:procollagen-lysine,2-oxoglutarate 5-dioxygenase n=1 Tax=Diachasmimorpha longicaudata TaxID=58733 RepID=UPI0030B8B1E0
MRSCWLIYSFLIILCGFIQVTRQDRNADPLIFTVASNHTDGLKRYLRSAKVQGFKENIKVLGFGQPWKGGNMKSLGGGYKINLLKKALKKFKSDTERIVLVTDGYDVIFLTSLDDIIRRFKSFNARIVFSAEGFCWPDKTLASQYPAITRGEPYLNSGGFIGFISDVYAMLTSSKVRDNDDDQLFYTKIYLDPAFREKHKIKLDHEAEIFQNLNGAVAKVELRFKKNEAYLQNTAYNTVPMIVHGNGHSKLVLNALGNYLARAWSPKEGCLNCYAGITKLPEDQAQTYPPILMALYIDRPTPFLEEFFQKIYHQDYPKFKLHLFIYNSIARHDSVITKFIGNSGSEYKSVQMIGHNDSIELSAAKSLAMDQCLRKECSGYFSVDSVAHLDNAQTLKLLVEQQRGIVGPLLVRREQTWSNFWGAIADNGYYARSADYMDIIRNKRRGLWNVPYITNCYLINVTLLSNPETRPVYTIEEIEPDMAFAMTNRHRDIFMYINNRYDFGHLVDPDNYDLSRKHPDLYEIISNKFDWQDRYIHENYSYNFSPHHKPIQPCTDVFWFPIVTTRFCREFIQIMESYGQWSDGSNHDFRLQGGYENVPTRDIHMNQVDYESQWLYFLKEYVRPLQELVFTGYFHDPPRSLMNFVVRYKPEEQPALRPHHDSSTYTINIALNEAGVDYEGGGCRFLRYNCSVTDTKVGWMLMHPGRLTHYHEGLQVTKGTRYIMISFVDP